MVLRRWENITGNLVLTTGMKTQIGHRFKSLKPLNSLWWPIYDFNAVVKTKQPFYTKPSRLITYQSSLSLSQITLVVRKKTGFEMNCGRNYVIKWLTRGLKPFVINLNLY